MSRNTKISAVLVALFAILVVVIATQAGGDEDESTTVPDTSAQTTAEENGDSQASVVASDPRRLGKPGSSGATFTEFLDFECEACGAAFPVIEQLREQYAGEVTFNLRYFPLEAHANSRNAAIAVEAAAQQGELEAMYEKMFETQSSWGEQQESQADLFRQFAEELGLDMKAYDAAVADPETEARVERDVQAGLELGVESTPTFFIDEERIEPRSVEDLQRQLDAAVAGS